MARKGVIADDSKSLRFVGRILAIGFLIAKNPPPGTICRAWVEKYLRRTKKFATLIKLEQIVI